MKTSIHERIVFWAKVIMFSAFILNIVRVAIKTWKYGGSTSKVSVSYEGTDECTDAPSDNEEA